MTTRRPAVLTQIAALVIASTVQETAAGTMDEAHTAYRRADYETAAMLYRAEAEQSNAIAQFQLGALYASGRGVAEDDTERANQPPPRAEEPARESQAALREFLGTAEADAQSETPLAEDEQD